MAFKEKIEKELEKLPCFEEQYVYGVASGIALFLVFLIGMKGFNYSLENYQVHAYTLFWIDMMWLLAYHALGDRGISKSSRVFVSMMVAVFIFEVHDNLWVTSTLFNLEQLMETDVGLVFVASREFYAAKYSRNMMITVTAFLLSRKHFNYSWMAACLVGLDLTYWAAMSYLGWIYMFPTFIVTFFMGSLPAVGLLFKEAKTR